MRRSCTSVPHARTPARHPSLDRPPVRGSAADQHRQFQQGYRLSSDAIPVFREYVERRRGQPNFANARSIRNAIERTRLRHAARLVGAGGTVDRDALELIEPADLLGSTVFDDAAVAEP